MAFCQECLGWSAAERLGASGRIVDRALPARLNYYMLAEVVNAANGWCVSAGLHWDLGNEPEGAGFRCYVGHIEKVGELWACEAIARIRHSETAGEARMKACV